MWGFWNSSQPPPPPALPIACALLTVGSNAVAPGDGCCSPPVIATPPVPPGGTDPGPPQGAPCLHRVPGAAPHPDSATQGLPELASILCGLISWLLDSCPWQRQDSQPPPVWALSEDPKLVTSNPSTGTRYPQGQRGLSPIRSCRGSGLTSQTQAAAIFSLFSRRTPALSVCLSIRCHHRCDRFIQMERQGSSGVGSLLSGVPDEAVV